MMTPDNNQNNQLVVVKKRTPRKPKVYTVKTLSTQSHMFNVGIATDYNSPGMALWLGHLAFWAEKNLVKNKHIHDGLVWCYDTLEALLKYFPYYTQRQLETIIDNSVKEGLVKKGNYNNTPYDRTKWYALTPRAYFYFQYLLTDDNLKNLFDSISQICEINFSEFVNVFPRSVTPIPDTKPYTDPDNKYKRSSDDETPCVNGLCYNELDKNRDKPETKMDDFEKIGAQAPDLKITSTKSDYFDNQATKETQKTNNKHLNLNDLLLDNPFNIPEQLLEGWLDNRKYKRNPATQRSWITIKKKLQQCKEQGIDTTKAFEEMVDKEWLSFEPEWLKFNTAKEDKQAIKQQILERERKAAEEKRKEIEASKQFKSIVMQTNRKSRAEIEAEQEKKRLALGMTHKEYAAYVLSQPYNG